MTLLTDEIKQRINRNYQKYVPLVNKYTKEKPEIGFNYFDGHYMSVYWCNEKASVEFMVYRGRVEFNAHREDESEWMEIGDGGGSKSMSCIERFGNRVWVDNIIKEEYIKEGFEWMSYS